MKLVNDKGEVIEAFDDKTACLFLGPGGELATVLPRGKANDIVAMNVKLIGALTVFLTDKNNVELVLRVLPKERNEKHRHN
jgi:hypothetical protein